MYDSQTIHMYENAQIKNKADLSEKTFKIIRSFVLLKDTENQRHEIKSGKDGNKTKVSKIIIENICRSYEI